MGVDEKGAMELEVSAVWPWGFSADSSTFELCNLGGVAWTLQI